MKTFGEFSEERELQEDLNVIMPALIGVNFLALVGLMAYQGIKLGGQVNRTVKRTSRGRDSLIPASIEKKFNELKSKFKNKSYEPSKEDIKTAQDIGKEVKKIDPSAYKKKKKRAKKLK